MDKLKFERLYKERNLDNYNIKSTKELFFIHGIKLNQVDGFNRLSKYKKKLVEETIISYLNSNEINKRDIVILKVESNLKDKEMLRIEYIEDGKIYFKDIE